MRVGSANVARKGAHTSLKAKMLHNAQVNIHNEAHIGLRHWKIIKCCVPDYHLQQQDAKQSKLT